MSVLKNIRWKLYDFYLGCLFRWGIEKEHIKPYDIALIKKLRNVYYGGVPASVLLLCNATTNGKCYDRALLMSRAFLDEEGDVKIIYARIASLRFDPSCKDKTYGDHCVVERITKNGQHFIYDTSTGLVYKKWLYWLTEFPKVRLIRNKTEITNYIEEISKSSSIHTANLPIMGGAFALDLIIPTIEATYGKEGEMYSSPGIELLQHEVELFKKEVIATL